ncbi:hypothetical protein MKX01_026458 [Papaver californicum]|nr:hypothetical protein MKX01_026458 [Papaver californicum]
MSRSSSSTFRSFPTTVSSSSWASGERAHVNDTDVVSEPAEIRVMELTYQTRGFYHSVPIVTDEEIVLFFVKN